METIEELKEIQKNLELEHKKVTLKILLKKIKESV